MADRVKDLNKEPQVLLQLIANGLINGCLCSLMAVSFALIYNTTRIFHVAHGAVYTSAAYLCYFFSVQRGWSLPASITVTLILIALIGLLMEKLMYAPLERKKASLLVSLISSLGLYIVLVNLVALRWGNETQVLRPGVETTYNWGEVILTRVQLAQVVSALVVIPLVLLLLKCSQLGKMIRAVR
ncbi:MAG TPA: hypothetical protein VGB77_03395, partial [Abditibacteriaceae bacterium]